MARLADITDQVANIKPELRPSQRFCYVDIGSIDNRTNRIAETKQFHGAEAPSRARRPVQAGDVLFSNVRTYLRNIALITNDVPADLCSTGFTVLRANAATLPAYLFYSVVSDAFIDAVSETQTGTHYPATNDDQVRGSTIPLPPLAEQKRIVEAIERLTARVDAARERLANVPAILKRFRQAVLAAACSGDLTTDWRHANPAVRPSSESLAKFDSQASQHRQGSKARKGGNELDLEAMPELPETWVYRRADSVVADGTVITYGIVLPGPEIPNGVPYVRQQDIQDGRLLVDELRRTTPEIAAKHDRSALLSGDVLLCIIRHLRVAVVPPGIDGANLTQGTVRMRPSPVMTGPFLAKYLAGPHAQAWMKQRHFGMSMPRINVEHARAIPVAVPPPSEQREITRRVEALMKLADTIEQHVATAKACADKTTQAILAKVFRGELVPTEADFARAEGRDYEPAADLLARINAATAHPARPDPKRHPRKTQATSTKSIKARRDRRTGNG